ncbi:hypothetical protein K4K59_002751 [Colletotrichum sp. SAR11_240]|nr:hypothetical protein K4K59_002751 [Colletotrichum sp. SAR11_240]
MICPFCGIAGGGEYEMLTHMESFHPEEDQASSSQAAQEQYAECPIEGCGEVLSIAEMDYHVDLHVEEQRQGVSDPSENLTANGTASSRMTPEVGAMMVSYINGANAYGRDQFRGRLPTIFEIQEYIENAWDMGINAQGRLETGGIKGTRKYIGTPEAQALFVSLQIPCTAQGFKDAEPGRSEAKLMYAVEQYFKHGMQSPPAKVTCTQLPPIYFQHAGHSLTIVGFERQKNGPSNLLVFDPMFRDAPALARLIGQTFKHRSADESLKPYRRGSKYLRRYREFEILRLDGSQLSPPQSSR